MSTLVNYQRCVRTAATTTARLAVGRGVGARLAQNEW